MRHIVFRVYDNAILMSYLDDGTMPKTKRTPLMVWNTLTSGQTNIEPYAMWNDRHLTLFYEAQTGTPLKPSTPLNAIEVRRWWYSNTEPDGTDRYVLYANWLHQRYPA